MLCFKHGDLIMGNKFYLSLNPNEKQLANIADGAKLKRKGYAHHSFFKKPNLGAIRLIKEPEKVDLLRKALRTMDEFTLEIHAEGLPFIIGKPKSSNKYDHSPYQLAKLIGSFVENKNSTFYIDLRTCLSAVPARYKNETIIYAQDLSRFLANFGFKNAFVYGYTGYLLSDDVLKQSVVDKSFMKGAKAKHCSLEDGRAIYKNGECVHEAKKVIVNQYALMKKDLEEFTQALDEREQQTKSNFSHAI